MKCSNCRTLKHRKLNYIGRDGYCRSCYDRMLELKGQPENGEILEDRLEIWLLRREELQQQVAEAEQRIKFLEQWLLRRQELQRQLTETEERINFLEHIDDQVPPAKKRRANQQVYGQKVRVPVASLELFDPGNVIWVRDEQGNIILQIQSKGIDVKHSGSAYSNCSIELDKKITFSLLNGV